MAKLWYFYGTMGSSKSAQLLMTAYNYEEKGLVPLVLKPQMDTRDGKKVIKSRIGLTRKVEFVEDYLIAPFEIVKERLQGYDVVIIDEIQFCDVSLVPILNRIVEEIQIPVMCYGLYDDFMLNPFPISKELKSQKYVELRELKTVCWCGDGATCNARINSKGEVVKKGKTIQLGGNDRYISLCLKHYREGDIGDYARKKLIKV